MRLLKMGGGKRERANLALDCVSKEFRFVISFLHVIEQKCDFEKKNVCSVACKERYHLRDKLGK